MTKTSAALSGLAFVAALLPAAVFAQEQPADPQGPQPAAVRRPYRGLFGAPPDPTQGQSLVLTGSVYASYDDNVLGDDNVSASILRDPNLRRSGYFPGAQGELEYARTGDRGSFDAMAGAQVRYQRDTSDFSSSYRTGAHLTRMLGRKTTIRGGYSLLYTPYYLVLFPGLAGADEPDATLEPVQDLFRRTAYRHAADATFLRTLSRRSALSFTYGIRKVDFVEQSNRDFSSQEYGVAFSDQLTSHATLNLGYRYHVAEHSGALGRRSEVHDIDAGVNYSRALSLSRRTFFGFSTGSAIVVADQLSVPSSEPRAQLRLIGDARLTHEMGRTWTALAFYRRALTFREGFNDLFLNDGVGGTVEGFLTRRMDLSSMLQWTHATVAATGNKAYDALMGSAQLRYGLSRHLALFGRYMYYQYQFDDRLPVDSRLARSLDRNSVRVGLMVAVPFIQ